MRRPRLLWHYTDQIGLFAIVSSSTIRLGDTRFLNDRTEHSFARKVIRERLEELATQRSDDLLRLLATFVSLSSSRGDSVFAASFSEVADSISQWQRYGADGYGYAIAFDPDALVEGMRVGDRRPELHRILYDLKRQHAAISLAVSRFFRGEASLVRRLGVTAEQWQRVRLAAISMRMDEVAAQIKNPSFSDEREWRFVCGVREIERRSLVEFSSRGSYVKPYVSATFRATGTHLPIRQVVCGPRLEATIAVDPLRQLLTAKGFENVEVSQSSLSDVWR